MTAAAKTDARDLTAVNWLVTGGCGFIGRSLIAELMARGVPMGRIRVLDNLAVGSIADLEELAPALTDADWSETASGIGLLVGDILDADRAAAAARGADILVHLAACTGVPGSVENPMFDCRTNVVGTLNCLEAARHGGARRFVFASSGAPLGLVDPPIHEKVVPRPISPYGASKLAGEAYCSAYHHCFGVEAVALRFGNVYGPLSTHKSSVVAKFIRRALAGETLEIYGDGHATRDYIFASDIADAVIRAATTAGAGGEVFQIATARETTVLEIAERLKAVLAARGIAGVEIAFSPPRQGDMPRNYSDTTKARQMLGWQSRMTLDEGLAVTADAFLARRAAS